MTIVWGLGKVPRAAGQVRKILGGRLGMWRDPREGPAWEYRESTEAAEPDTFPTEKEKPRPAQEPIPDQSVLEPAGLSRKDLRAPPGD